MANPTNLEIGRINWQCNLYQFRGLHQNGSESHENMWLNLPLKLNNKKQVVSETGSINTDVAISKQNAYILSNSQKKDEQKLWAVNSAA